MPAVLRTKDGREMRKKVRLLWLNIKVYAPDIYLNHYPELMEACSETALFKIPIEFLAKLDGDFYIRLCFPNNMNIVGTCFSFNYFYSLVLA